MRGEGGGRGEEGDGDLREMDMREMDMREEMEEVRGEMGMEI